MIDPMIANRYRLITARRDFHCEVNAIARSHFELAKQTTVYNYRLYKLDHIHGNSTTNMIAKRYQSSDTIGKSSNQVIKPRQRGLPGMARSALSRIARWGNVWGAGYVSPPCPP